MFRSSITMYSVVVTRHRASLTGISINYELRRLYVVRNPFFFRLLHHGSKGSSFWMAWYFRNTVSVIASERYTAINCLFVYAIKFLGLLFMLLALPAKRLLQFTKKFG
jgi:hypothetical protein